MGLLNGVTTPPAPGPRQPRGFFWPNRSRLVAGGGYKRIPAAWDSVVYTPPSPNTTPMSLFKTDINVRFGTCGTFCTHGNLTTVGVTPGFWRELVVQNPLVGACSHRLVRARCWPVKPKSPLKGFSFGAEDPTGLRPLVAHLNRWLGRIDT